MMVLYRLLESSSSYLESLVEATGRITGEIDQCIVQASKAFGSLRSAVFFSLETKRLVYCSVVLEVLVYDGHLYTGSG